MIKKNKIFICCFCISILTSFTSKFLSDENQVDGIFRVNKAVIENYGGVSLFDKYFAIAYFPTDTSGTYSIFNRDYGGELKLNGSILKFDTVSFFYFDTTLNLLTSQGFLWNIGGSEQINSFAYVNARPFPNFNYNSNSFQNVIDTSTNLQLNINNISSTDSIFILLSCADSAIAKPHIKKAYAIDDNSYFIEKELLKHFNPGQSIHLQIELNNYAYQQIGGKNYYFINTFAYKKLVTINQGQ